MFQLKHILADCSVVLFDGAIGTELARRGVSTALPLWSAAALEFHPDTVLQIHRDYVDAGAQIIIANSFRTTTFTYTEAGMEASSARGKARKMTHRAVDLARQAVRGKPAWVAGSMAPVADCYTPGDYPGREMAVRIYGELAGDLADAGVDLLLLETQITLAEIEVALEAASPTGLPVMASFLADRGMRLLGGAPLAEAIALAESAGAEGVLVNCVTLDTADALAPQLRRLTGLPFGIYANAGVSFPEKGGSIDQTHSDKRFAQSVARWIDSGVSMVGGCCGTTPDTIAAVREALSRLDLRPQRV